MTQYPNLQSNAKRKSRGVPNSTSESTASTNLSSSEIVQRIQQVATAQNGQTYAGQELAETLAEMYPDPPTAPAHRGTIQCIFQVPAPINALTWSPDETYIAFSYGETVQICDVETRETIAVFSPHVFFKRASVAVTALAFSPDNKWLALARSDGNVEVLDVASGKWPFLPYSGHKPSPVQAVAWSHSGDYLASSDSKGRVHVWNFATGKRSLQYTTQEASSPIHFMWSTNDKQFVYWSKTEIYLFDNKHSSIYKAPYEVKAVAQFNNIWHVGWVRDTVIIEIVNLNDSWKESLLNIVEKNWRGWSTYRYTEHDSQVSTIAFSPDGKCIASSSEDLKIQLWDTQDREVFTFGVHPVPISLLLWSPTGKYIASADEQGIVLVWLAA